MTNIIENAVNVLVLDDKFGKINSHWPSSTSKFKIVQRVYYDEENFEKKVIEAFEKEQINIIAFSGKKACEAFNFLKMQLLWMSKSAYYQYINTPKIMKIHNTNIGICMDKKDISNRITVKKSGNDWVKISLDNPFDMIFIQTYGDSKILNDLNKNNKAFWVPYLYNDNLYFDRKLEKRVDIGAYFKIERHEHRIQFIEKIKRIAERNNYSFEFSDQYWGENYAKKISEAKIVVHLSYCGDIPWRLYECAASSTCFLSDPLEHNIKKLFQRKNYVEYKKDYTDIENKIRYVMQNDSFRKRIESRAKEDVKKYAWSQNADYWILPLIRKLL